MIKTFKQLVEHIQAMFITDRGDKPVTAAENLSPGHTTKAIGDFLLDLGHAQIQLRKIVIKGNPEIVYERQGFIRIFFEPIKSIAGRCFLDSIVLTRSALLTLNRIDSIIRVDHLFVSISIATNSAGWINSKSPEFLTPDPPSIVISHIFIAFWPFHKTLKPSRIATSY